MNINYGQSAKKQHLFNGSRTFCNRRTSGINVHEFESFKSWVEEVPDMCCKKCMNRVVEKSNQIIKTK